ncbi:hypothetical protein J0H58_30960, partial [bacterium]|nr:hypothetical protein [bacterium]
MAALALPLVLVGLPTPRPSLRDEPPTAQAEGPLPPGAVARLGSARFRHPGGVHAVAFSPDGKLLAASSDDPNEVAVWDRATGRRLHRLTVPDGFPPNRLCFSPDSRRLTVGLVHGRGGAFAVWDAATGEAVTDFPPPPEASRVLMFTPDAREAILLQ